MAYYGYIRTSINTKQKYSYENQMKEINEYEKKKGIKIDRIFEELDCPVLWMDEVLDEKDAFKGREQLGLLMKLLNKGDTVVVLNTNRIWKPNDAKTYIKRKIYQKGAKIKSIEQPDYKNGMFRDFYFDIKELLEAYKEEIEMESGK